MKILSGQFRGKDIPFRPSPHLRPTPDKVRKALIETLIQVLPGARVLDAYAGTGALGLEALSAGASEVYFVEKHAAACASLRKIAEALAGKGRTRVYCDDAIEAARDFAGSKTNFDIIFADPPYEKGMAQDFLSAAAEQGILAAGGWLVVETYKTEPMPENSGPLVLKRRTVYGDTAVHYYNRQAGFSPS